MKGVKCEIRKIRGKFFPLYSEFSENLKYVTLVSSEDYIFPEIDEASKSAPPVTIVNQYLVDSNQKIHGIHLYPIIDNKADRSRGFGGYGVLIDHNHCPENLINNLNELYSNAGVENGCIELGLSDRILK